MIDNQNIYLDIDVPNYEKLFIKMNEIFLKRDYVNNQYLDMILKREKNYPTGLNFGKYCISIPHTYPECIKEEKIVFIRLVNPINFIEMGSTDIKLDVKVVVMLLIKRGDKQVDLLLKLMKLFEDENNYNFLETQKDVNKIYEFLNNKLDWKG